MRSIFWFRNDLRVHDQPALHQCLAESTSVLAVYCFDPRQFRMLPLGFRKTSYKRFVFLGNSLLDLRQQLRERGGELTLRLGKPEEILPQLAREHRIDCIFTSAEIASEEKQVQSKVAESFDGPIRTFETRLLYQADTTPFGPNRFPKTFKTFRKHLSADSLIPQECPTPAQFPSISVTEPGTVPDPRLLGFTAGELQAPSQPHLMAGTTAGLKRLQYYTFDSQYLNRYKYTRNQSLGTDYSSQFSIYLANGSLSVRKIYWEVKRYEQEVKRNISTWWLQFELLWREFFQWWGMIYGDRIFKPSGIRNRSVDFNSNTELFWRWAQGNTGVPFVDAHLRQLEQTGFMSNRGRVNCASFLAHDYQVDWTWGAAWFEAHLLDYDVCSNWGNWNMQATETRYTNPVYQGFKYDSKGDYVREWLPELSEVPGPVVQAPWLLEEFPTLAALPDYPAPETIYPKWRYALEQIRSKLK